MVPSVHAVSSVHKVPQTAEAAPTRSFCDCSARHRRRKVTPTPLGEGLKGVPAGAIYALLEGNKQEEELIDQEVASHTVVTTAFVVVFIAEWGDLTQILAANLAAHYHSGLSVALGAVLALWTVAGLAVLGGQGLLRFVKISTIRKITAVVLFVFAAVAAFQAVR
jgi:putative Ca2+/H+ antiporter (TMEM165/GDT1 family)